MFNQFEQERRADDDQQLYSLQFEKEGIQWCYALAMNWNLSILINGQASDIQLWQFEDDGQLFLKEILKGHSNWIKCLRFSQTDNWFVSGSWDKSLRIWNEQENLTWACVQVLEGHTNYIRDVTLNVQENQIISSSWDNTIKIWMRQKLNEGQWGCNQTLTEPTKDIYFLSLNQDCDQLASCGYDMLRLWQKGKDQQWTQQQVIDNPQNDEYRRVCFIEDNVLIATTKQLGRLYRIVQNEQKLYEVASELFLNNDSEEDDYSFSINYCKSKNLLICRHGRGNIYILSKQTNGEFIVSQTINEDLISLYISQNGKYLIFTDKKVNKIQVWNSN